MKRFVRYGFIRAIAWVLALFPMHLVAWVGEQIGGLAFTLLRTERERALQSLATAYPEQTEHWRRQLAVKAFRHLGRSAGQLLCIRQLDQQIETLVEWPEADRSVLTDALARGRGIVFVSGHVGNWELLARRVAMAGFPCQTIAREMTDERLAKWIDSFRQSGRLKTIWRGHDGAVKDMLRALRRGEILGLVIDQDTRVQSVFVPFFGMLAKTPRAAADLALKTGAAVILGFCQRQPDGRYRLTMRELAHPSEASEEETLRLTAEMTLGIERAIREFPEQWVWMHRRWRSRPT